MCENSCICYTGSYELYQNCPICNSFRFNAKGKAKKVMPYLSLIDRLKVQFNDNNRSKELLYRYEYITNKNDDLDDIFDGKIYKELVNKNLFNDERDVALTASCDGYQIFKQKTDDCWLFIVINNNLHPSLRVKKENLLVPFIIPGPNQPKDFNTFLRPFINEMKQLESKYFIYIYLYNNNILNNIFILGGVLCYDAYTKSNFILRAHIIAWTGDIPALTAIMNITGHNSYSGCRFVIFKEFIQFNIYMFIFILVIFQDHFQSILCIYSLKISLHKCLSCGLLIFLKMII